MDNWYSHFPALQQISDPVALQALQQVERLSLSHGTVVFEEGSPCSRYLFVLSGSVRVQQCSPQGREIVLYRVGPGETCILTTACLLSHHRYPAMGLAETPVQAITLAADAFQQAIAASASFRDFVFQAYGQRLSEMLLVMEEVAFTRLDVRLARRLLSLSGDQGHLTITHQELALELGSAREVISRLLKDFETRGWLHRRTGLVQILDRQALERLAADVW
ncbi:Crp/Fnr family transcriptional regulator [Acidithiobacillus sp. AMEEHan]|uniref:Crp/Fnr family transcriptional regulator n=1 Tax=Acidithiobacillus sp. AMEEHan TaxID=2994951 RepID=UPI0027E4D27B|nr:Crp/Fnr family transcriptional regulator [Acidithiobacillus sp. AMEEHan]